MASTPLIFQLNKKSPFVNLAEVNPEGPIPMSPSTPFEPIYPEPLQPDHITYTTMPSGAKHPDKRDA